MLYGETAVSVGGFGCVPAGGMTIRVSPGAVIAPGTVDDTAYGSLPAVSSQLPRQHIMRDPLTLTVPGSGTYVVYVTTTQGDVSTIVLPYYDATLPSQPFAGPNNSGSSAPTVRSDAATVGVAATVPAGGIALWNVVVPSGATTVTAAMITLVSGALANTIPQLAPKDSPAFTTMLAATYGSGFMLRLQTDGTAVFYDTANNAIFSVTAGGPISRQPLTVFANINGKYDYVGNGAVGIGGSYSAGGPASNNFQWTGNDTSGYNPVYSHTNGFYQAIGGLYSYSTSAACAYFGTSVTGPVVNFYGTGGVAGTISINSSGGVSFNTTSDYRLKTGVQAITAADAEGRLRKLAPSSFVRSDAPVPQRVTGYIAHDYGVPYPWALTGEKDATVENDLGDTVIVPQQIDPTASNPDIVVLLLAAVDRIAKLEAALAAKGS